MTIKELKDYAYSIPDVVEDPGQIINELISKIHKLSEPDKCAGNKEIAKKWYMRAFTKIEAFQKLAEKQFEDIWAKEELETVEPKVTAKSILEAHIHTFNSSVNDISKFKLDDRELGMFVSAMEEYSLPAFTELEYWKSRCEAAENVIEVWRKWADGAIGKEERERMDSDFNNAGDAWNELKNKAQ